MRSTRDQPAQPEAPEPRTPAEETDWLAWGLHLAFGLLVGGFFGWSALRFFRRSRWESIDWPVLVAVGCALICGAYGSLRGDRAWIDALDRRGR